MSSEDTFTSVQWDRGESYEQTANVIPIPGEAALSPTNYGEVDSEQARSDIKGEFSASLSTESSALDLPQSAIPEDSIENTNAIAYAPIQTPQEPYTYNKSRTSSEEGNLKNCTNEEASNVEPTLKVHLAEEESNSADMHHMEEQFNKYLLQLVVSSPIFDKDPNGKLYISYLIESMTDHPDVKKLLQKEALAEGLVTLKVRRRYRDFCFLSACLTSDFPQLLVPPLPPKLNFKYLTGDTFSRAFVQKRLSSLSHFITFICEHKILSQLAVFHYFLSDSSEWGTFTRNLKISKNGTVPWSSDDSEALLVGKVVNEELLTETVMNFFTSSKHKRETNKDILEISDKLKKFYENLVKLDKIFTRLNKKNDDLRNDYEQFLVQVSKLGAIQILTARANENGSVDTNSSLASAASMEGTLSYASNCKVFSKSLLFFLERWRQLHQYIDEEFSISLKDCAKYIIKLSDLIELQHNKKIDLQVLQDYLAKARAELANLNGATTNALNAASHSSAPSAALINQSRGGIVNNTTQLIKDTLSTSATQHIGSTQSVIKKAKLEQRIVSLEGEIVAQTKVVNAVTNQIVHEEYPNWDRYNKKQLKNSMVNLCDQEISFYKDLLENWKGVELKLEARLAELS